MNKISLRSSRAEVSRIRRAGGGHARVLLAHLLLVRAPTAGSRASRARLARASCPPCAHLLPTSRAPRARLLLASCSPLARLFLSCSSQLTKFPLATVPTILGKVVHLVGTPPPIVLTMDSFDSFGSLLDGFAAQFRSARVGACDPSVASVRFSSWTWHFTPKPAHVDARRSSYRALRRRPPRAAAEPRDDAAHQELST